MICGHILGRTIRMTDLESYKVYSDTTNNTTKFLCPMIFTSGANASRLLSNFGLVNVYVDDYGYKCKYTNCLFFLFKPTDKEAFQMFEDKITNFDSFYDYYDVDEMRMFVFKTSSLYHRDIELFKQGRFEEMSKDYKSLLHRDINFKDVVVDIPKEIYRFELSLS